jgi:hypothetical protein
VTRRVPDFDELVGDDLEPGERERLQKVHELLLAADPPPELSPELAESPERLQKVYPLFPRRRGVAAVLIAAAVAAAAFGIGFLVGDDNPPEPVRVVGLAPPGGATSARASLAIFDVDDGGNWPMMLTVRDLRGGSGVSYELWLTKHGKLADSCGAFVVSGDKTIVDLNAPYKLKRYDGWVIVRTGTTTPVLTT